MDQGLLVPDELVVDLVVDRVNQDDCVKRIRPGRIPEDNTSGRGSGTKPLSEMGQKVDYAINVEVPDENIVKRMSGRRDLC